MNKQQLFEQIKRKKSFLCVGLDTDYSKLPECVMGAEDPIFEFNRAIIDATAEYTVCYKPNLAFYEKHGSVGVASFERTCKYIKERYPEILVLADAKRGDIGNTSQMYAEAFYTDNLVDGVTLSPYMGQDTVAPFLKYTDKWAVILALTSNPSASDFETLELTSGERLFERVLRTAKSWGSDDNTMFVVGATQASMLEDVRRIVPDHFLLVPGVGAQGGSLSEVAKHGMNDHCGLLVNSSRGIIYADSTERFAQVAGQKAKELQQEMSPFLNF